MSRHVVVLGDGAELEAVVSELGAREDLRWTVLSASPRQAARRYGVDAVARFGFDALTATEREQRLGEVRSVAGGRARLAPGDPAGAVLDAVASADAVLVAGGELTSASPGHLYEVAAVAALAAHRRQPLVVSGQRLGPELAGRGGELVGEVLGAARLVGVRDRSSAELAARTGAGTDQLWCGVDDAALLAGTPVPELLIARGIAPGGFVLAALGEVPGGMPAEQVAEQLGELLARLVDSTGLDVLVEPAGAGDLPTRVVEAAKCDRVAALPVLDCRASAWIARQAALVVSTRLHPVAFALAGGVPAVGLSSEDRGERDLRGALEAAGLDGWCVSLLGLPSGVLAEALAEAWQRRQELAHRIAAAMGRERTGKRDYWDAVQLALRGEPAAARRPLPIDPQGLSPSGAWTLRNDDALAWDRLSAQHRQTCRHQAEQAAAELQVALQQLQREALERCRVVDQVSTLLEDLAVERAAGRVARDARAGQLDHALRQSAEYDALQQTKLLRWTRTARSVYRSVRRDLP